MKTVMIEKIPIVIPIKDKNVRSLLVTSELIASTIPSFINLRKTTIKGKAKNLNIAYTMIPQDFKNKAEKQKQENRKFFDKLKKSSPKNLDTLFHNAHEEVFEKTDCLKCANCCKTTSPIFYQRDIERIAKRLRIKPGDLIEKYLHIDEDQDYVLNTSPCPFLGADNYCSIYEDRPTACREYPHTNRKRMHQLIDLTYRNTLVCPAVLEITEKLKKDQLK